MLTSVKLLASFGFAHATLTAGFDKSRFVTRLAKQVSRQFFRVLRHAPEPQTSRRLFR